LNEKGDPSEKIKVVDRRRFTDDGDVKPDWEAAQPAGAEPTNGDPEVAKPEPTLAAPTPDRPPEPSAEIPQGTPSLFLDLVNDLAQQAALFLTGAEGLPAQPAHAQRLIDYLGLLETKTRGNLTAEESQVLSSVIFQLRTVFVQNKP
jgi:hypothetical protein